MSAQATGWVFSSSPYKGALFALHLAIADTVNDAYNNELWASVNSLAEKARLGDRIVRKGLAQMVNDGFLELMSAKEGHVRRYRFLMPDPCTTCTPAQGAPLNVVPEPLHVVPQPLHPVPGTPARGAPNPKRTQGEPKQPNSLALDLAAARQHRRPDDVSFDEFWAVYPLRKAKGAAKVAWAKALKRAPAEVIVAGAAAYAADPQRDPDYTKHPATWLDKECWTDEAPEPRRKRTKGTTAALNALERYGLTDAKELNQ